MELKRFLRLYKTVLIMVGVTLASLVGFFLGVVPLAQKTIQIAGTISALSSDISVLQTKSNILQSMDESTLRTGVLALAAAVPPDKSISTIMTTIDGVAGDSGVTIGSVSIQSPGSIATESAKKVTAQEAKIGGSILPVSVTVIGTLDQIRTFLNSVGAVRRYFGVDSVLISFSQAGINASTQLSAFYLPYPTTIAGVVTPIAALTSDEESTIARVSALPLKSSLTFAVGTASAVINTGGKLDPFSP